MRTLIIFFLLLFFASCKNQETKFEKEQFLGNDYRLFEKTPAWELAKAVEDEDTTKIGEILNNKKIDINFQEPKFGGTLLSLSIMNSQYQSAKKLLELGANPNVTDSYRGETAVINAASNDDPQYLELVLKYKGNPNAVENAPFKEDDQVRQTALLAAINLLDPNSLKKVKLLVEAGADINYCKKSPGVITKLPLAEAITARKMDVALYLLQNGADFNLSLYKTIDEKDVFILEALRKCIIDLKSEQYKSKLEVKKFLKEKGLDYNKEPIPDYILSKIKQKYPNEWEDYIKKY